MAKSKTFTTGQPLSAAEVNTYLNLDVPVAGDPQLEGPVAVSLQNITSGTAEFVRQGMLVHFRASLTLNLASLAQMTLASGGLIPARFRPSFLTPLVCSAFQGTSWNRPASAVLAASGDMYLINNHSAAITQIVIQGTYMRGI